MSRILFLITGGSRGFGASLAKSILLDSKALPHIAESIPFDLVVTGRSATNLNNVTQDLLVQNDTTSRILSQIVDYENVELLDESFNEFITNVLNPYKPEEYSHVYIFHNAGSLGKLDFMHTLSTKDIQQAMAINVIAPFTLSTLLLKTFTSSTMMIVNISSLAAVQPFECWSLYCAGKASRDMWFQCLSKEMGLLGKKCKTLNYAPGPLNTDMQDLIRSDMPDIPMRSMFQEMFERGQLVEPRESARALVGLLDREHEWESGVHIDYYDVKQ